MKITGIDCFPILMKPVKTGYRADDELSKLARVDTVLIRVNTDSSVYGLGEAATIRSYFNQTLHTMIDWIKAYEEVLIGHDPLDVIGAHVKLHLVSGEHPPGCHPSRAAVDMALYDIMGKVQECPVYKLLGGAYRTEFEMLTNLYEDTPEEKVKAAREFVKKGFKGLKVKVGDTLILKGYSMANLRKEVGKLKTSLEAVPEDIYVDADFNQALGNAKFAVKIVEEVTKDKFYSNLSIEQPLHYLDFTGHAYVRKAVKVPVILDESVVSPEAVFQIAKLEAADRIVLKINRVGGFWYALKIINICEAVSIGISLDTMPFTKLGDTAMCHLGAVIRDPYPVDAEGHLWFEDTPIKGGIQLKEGKAILPDTPGLGVELDEEKLHNMLIT